MDFKDGILVLHALASVIFLGNVIFSFFWKIMANNNGQTAVLTYGQRQLAWMDGLFTTASTTVIAITGYILAKLAGLNIFTTPWLLYSQIFFYTSAAIWALFLVPIQIRQLLLVKSLGSDDVVPSEYWGLASKWRVLWIIATILPLLSYFLMVVKPFS